MPRRPRALVGRLVRGGDISPELLTLVDGPLADAVVEAADYAGKSIAPGTVATYKADWSDFSQWARRNGVDPTVLPVHPVVVAAWLATLAPTLGRSALRRRIAAIAWHHRSLGHAWQAGHAAIRQTLTGIGREHPRPVRPAAALISADVKRLIAVCPGDWPACGPGAVSGRPRRRLPALGAGRHRCRPSAVRNRERDRAHPALEDRSGGAGGGRRPAAHARRGDVPGRRARGLAAAGKIRRGPVFRRITAAGTLEGRLTGDGVYKILRVRAAAAKLTVSENERLSPHGLRAGMITEATLNGALDEQIMPHSRHKDASSMRGYRRRARIVVDNPARLLDL